MNIRQSLHKLLPKWQYEFSDFKKLGIFISLCYFSTIVHLANSNRLLAVGFFIIIFTWLLGDEHRLKSIRINLINKIEEIKNKDDELAFQEHTITKQKSVNFIFILAIVFIICFAGDPQLVTNTLIVFVTFAIRLFLTVIGLNLIILKVIFGAYCIGASLSLEPILIELYPKMNIVLLILTSIFAPIAVFSGLFYFVYRISLIYKFLSFQKIRITKKIVSYIPT
jgi:hypothetical protein